ncbi:MAG: D-hexose-6-phosphate mutarotase [Planctomycetota bacterium]
MISPAQIPDDPRVSLTPTPTGQPRLNLNTPRYTAELHLHGAHLTAWQPAHQPPVLWLSKHAVFAPNTAIRGGIPLCFPWFAAHPSDPDAPSHGTARTSPWTLTHLHLDDDHTAHLTLNQTLDPFQAQYDITLNDTLDLRFTTTNPTDQPQRFELALHTYLTVADIHHVQVLGLENTDYLDNANNRSPHTQNDQPITFTQETDRLYINTPATVHAEDPGHNRRITVAKTGSQSTIVWNPWTNKSARLADFGDDEWPGMLCIESANAGPNALTLDPGQSQTLTTTISTEPLTP